MSEFEKQLENLINCYSLENESNTPDFILAEYLRGCLTVFANTVNAREKWYGREPKFLSTNDLSVSDGYCSARMDQTHCECWWEGKACCNCLRPADPIAPRESPFPP